MCGICGIVGSGRERAQRRAVVGRMMELLVHRGPDDSGAADGESFAVGHRRLAIIDLEHGKQPMYSRDGRYLLVFNGEIYNYLELRQDLIRRGKSFRTFSDTEVLLELLIEERASALGKLNGMFAFVFIDVMSNEWLMARDPMGIKPLYFVELEHELVFASEIKALLCHPDIRATPDRGALNEYMVFQFCLKERTLFQDVRKLEPGCYATGRGSKLAERHRYWDTDYSIDEHHTEAYFLDRLRSLLSDAARLQIRSDVKLGVYLSGGLDSSIVASMAAGHVGSGLPVFHGTFAEGGKYDESRYARIMASHIGAEFHVVAPGPNDFIEDIPRLIFAMDEPAAGPGLFPQYRVSRLAAEHVKVVLGGQGGDELFGGYARYLVGYLEQALKGAIFETQEEGSHVVTLSSIIPNLPLLKQYAPLMQHFWRDGLFEAMDARYFRLIDRSPEIEGVLSDEARATMDREAVFEEFQEVFNHPSTRSYVNKMTHFDLKTLLPALLQVEDRVSMSASIESRVPLLDTRIVDLTTSVPPQMKFHGGRSKHVLRRSVETVLPPDVSQRKDKMGFPVPFTEWIKTDPVRSFVGDILLSQATRERGLFSVNGLQKLMKLEAGFGRQIWGALCIELWHQRFIDGTERRIV